MHGEHEYRRRRTSPNVASAIGSPRTLEPGQLSCSALLRKAAQATASGLVQRKARDGNGVADDAAHAVASASSSTGCALPDTLLRKFESSLGVDLSRVRIHTGSASARAADAVGARAYTMGSDIHFGAGYYDPSSITGQHLLAHEVAHTVQQSGSPLRMQRKLEVSSPGDSLEQEADGAADAMVSGRSATIASTASSRALYRAPSRPNNKTVTDDRPASRRDAGDRKTASGRDQAIAQLLRIVRRGIDEADDGRWIQDDQIDQQRGFFGTVSDTLNQVDVPYIGMWTNANNELVIAEKKLLEGNTRGGVNYALSGLGLLRDSKLAWSKYVHQSAEGANATIADLCLVRDLSAVAFAALATGGAAATALGSGVLSAGVSTIAAATSGTLVATDSDTPMGEAVRGTLDEISRTGIEKNLGYAVHGLGGMIAGAGKELSDMPGQLVQLPEAIGKAGSWFLTAFTDRKRFLADLEKLPSVLRALGDWSWLERLPPNKQAWAIGEIFGHLEGMLMALAAGDAVGRGAGDLASGLEAGTMQPVPVGNALSPQLATAVGSVRVAQACLVNLAHAAAVAGPLLGESMMMASVAAKTSKLKPSAGGGSGSKLPPLKEGQVSEYKQANHPSRRRDKLDAHEIIQHAWLKVMGMSRSRKSGMNAYNATMAVTRDQHRLITYWQKELKLHEPARLAKLKLSELIELNAQCMLASGVSQELVDEFIEYALEQVPAIGMEHW